MILDLETYALGGADAYLEPVSAPSNYKDPEKIAAYIAERQAELLSKCALDPDLCRIVAIGWITDAGTGVEVCDHENQERGLLEQVWHAVATQGFLIGFNILGFDLPVMIRRSQYLGLAVPSNALSLDRYRTAHVDLMERLSFNGKLKYRSLDFYCKRFGITVPDEHSGKDIAALVDANDWEAVAGHCRADLLKTQALARRIGVLNPQAAQAVGAF